MRINGLASVTDDSDALAAFDGAQAVVIVQVERIFPNCPRYVHQMALVEPSVYSPKPGHSPPEPEWKRMKVFRDVLPPAPPAH
jgi:hypothetical protein